MLTEKITNKEEDINTNIILKMEKTSYEYYPPLYINKNIISNIFLNTKKRLSIRLLEIIRNDDTLSEEDKLKTSELIEKIKNNELDYIYVYSDINRINDTFISTLKNNEESIEEPRLDVIPDTLDFDVEFYKIGRKCSGLKKRYAIIRDGKLYSSDKPLSELEKYDEKEWEKMKQKTKFLEGAEVINESFDKYDKGMGEWSNKEKKFRIRINYIDDKEKNKKSSFFFYFDNNKKMKDVELAIFNLIKSDNYKLVSKNNLDNLRQISEYSYKFYTIMKILSVKNKIKKNKLENKVVNEALKTYKNYKVIIIKKILAVKNKIKRRKKIYNLIGNLSKKNIRIRVDLKQEILDKISTEINLVENESSINNTKNKEIDDYNHKKNLGGNIDEIDYDHFKIRLNVECIIIIESINLIENFIFDKEGTNYIRFSLKSDFNDKIDITKISIQQDVIETIKSKSYYFKKRANINRKKFEEGQRKIVFGKDMNGGIKTIFEYFCVNKYTLIMELNDKNKYFSNLVIDNNPETICDICEVPIYKDNIIVGNIIVDIYENYMDKPPFQHYQDEKEKEVDNPYQIVEDIYKINDECNQQMEKYHLGLYEPNIFRRKISRKMNEIGMRYYNDEINILNSDKKKLNEIIEKECIKNINNNNRLNDVQKSFEDYKKKLILKLLKAKRHEHFMKIFRHSQWKLFLRGNIDNIKKDDLTRNKKITDKLYNLICYGIYEKSLRKKIYSIFLDLDEISEKTQQILNINKNGFFNYFKRKIKNKNNIIFSLIDNDCTYLCSLPNSNYNNITAVNEIAKSYFLWIEEIIGLDNDREKYVYFLGMLYIIYKLYNYFEDKNLTLLILIGLSQKICHFKQKNQLFNKEINYINLYGLVTKLILEKHQKKIFEKFQSLNFPIDFFISQHLSSLFADYFNEELMMRIFDILIYESGIQGKFIDNMQYLRILCAIPITLFELNKKDILECNSISELESILNNLISHTFNINKFKVHLQKSLDEIYYLTGKFEKYIKRDEKRAWDDKRAKICKLINNHFEPIYEENMKYLLQIKDELDRQSKSVKDIYEEYFKNLSEENSLKLVKSLYKTSNRIMVQISKFQQIYNNQIKDLNEFKLEISFEKIEDITPVKSYNINFDTDKNEIKNIQELYFEVSFPANHLPEYIIFKLIDTINNVEFSSFSYNILNCELMKIKIITLENKEKENKYLLEFILFKDTIVTIKDNTFDIYNEVFRPPSYHHSEQIEAQLSSLNVSGFFFNNKLNKLIQSNNENMNQVINSNNNYDKNKFELFKKLNNIQIENTNNLEFKIKEQFFNKIKFLKTWFINSNLSLEEIFYSLALVDKSITINDKLYLLFYIALTKDKFLYNKKRISITKLKEMIYSLYKRYMIYFSKNDVDRMVEFLVKDERTFNIKYAFLYNAKDENIINNFIYDKERYDPRLHNKKFFEIFFDDINKQLNIYLNYLNNNYNITEVPKDILIFILIQILNNSENISQYIKHQFDKLTLVIESNNLMYRRDFKIVYFFSSVSLIKEIDSNINKNDDESKNNNQVLLNKISNLDINTIYNFDEFISFDKFKKIFFKLPYLSDMLRISLTYLSKDINQDNIKEFNNFKVSIAFENDPGLIFSYKKVESIIIPKNKQKNYYNFFFPNNPEISNQRENINMNEKIKINYTIFDIIKKLIDKLKQNNEPENKVKIIEDNLKIIDRVNCYLYYYENENIQYEDKIRKIGYFENLSSCSDLKDKTLIELKIIFSPESFVLSKTDSIRLKKKGYSKVYYNKHDFVWKKFKFKKEENKTGNFKCFDSYSPSLIDENDYVLAYNYEP